MTIWLAVIIGSAAVYSWKIFGHLVPQRLMNNPRLLQVSSMLTSALLAGLVGIQAFISKGQFHADARIPAVLVAVLLTILRVPFVIMVIVAGLVAAGCRYFLGW
jgi:ABC-type transporter Mla maintaining outer membrane lipid asymmetry permease subunit MlaE